MTTAEQLRDFLRETIETRFKNLSEFSKESGLRQGTIHEILYSKTKAPNPSTETIERFARGLGYKKTWQLMRDAEETYEQKKTPTQCMNGMSVSAQA